MPDVIARPDEDFATAAWAEVLGAPLKVAEGLAPRDDPSIWARRLTTEPGDVLLVGHLPNLARLAAVLVADDQERPVVAFQQGGLVGLEQARRAGRSTRTGDVAQVDGPE